jgi:hypothetical protein
MSTLKVQEAPQAPSYEAQGIQVPANIATPQASMESVKNQQTQLNSVNNLTGGRRKHSRKHGHKSVIRTYKGRRYISQEQKGGSQQGGQIAIPQVGSTCTSGPQCSGAQNANFTAINNQAQSSSINDQYAKQGGGRRRSSMKYRTRRHKPRHDQSLTTIIAYNIKKVLRKVFT